MLQTMIDASQANVNGYGAAQALQGQRDGRRPRVEDRLAVRPDDRHLRGRPRRLRPEGRRRLHQAQRAAHAHRGEARAQRRGHGTTLMPSFDIVSEVNQVEVSNAVDQANKEISTRFDFKGSDARVEHKEKELTLYADDDFKLKQVTDVLLGKLTKRGVDVRSLEFGNIEKMSGDKVKQVGDDPRRRRAGAGEEDRQDDQGQQAQGPGEHPGRRRARLRAPSATNCRTRSRWSRSRSPIFRCSSAISATDQPVAAGTRHFASRSCCDLFTPADAPRVQAARRRCRSRRRRRHRSRIRIPTARPQPGSRARTPTASAERNTPTRSPVADGRAADRRHRHCGRWPTSTTTSATGSAAPYWGRGYATAATMAITALASATWMRGADRFAPRSAIRRPARAGEVRLRAAAHRSCASIAAGSRPSACAASRATPGNCGSAARRASDCRGRLDARPV